MKWQLQSTTIPTSIHELRDALLANRQLTDSSAFFQPPSPLDTPLESLGFDMNALSSIKQRLEDALKKQETIVIFGDYDADGISATALLWQALHSLGHRVYPYIPNRLKHGYGLSIKALEDVFTLHETTSLIITVDNGIVAHKALSFLQAKNIDVIVTDHHQRDEQVVQALAVFHSGMVCGSGVAWFLSRALGVDHALLKELLALAALATVTDLMPVVGVNRSILAHGLAQLRTTKLVSWQALFEAAQVSQEKIDTYTLGFQLGPRINAMGRLADGMDALRLLCTKDSVKAKQLSQMLQQTNLDRQNLTLDVTQAAEKLVAQKPEEKLIFLYSKDYHEGVIGLIAGRLTEKFSKPSIVISEGERTSKASARSLSGFNITEFIRSFKDDLLEMGGHPLAAGFAVETSKLVSLQEKMQAKAQEILKDVDLVKTLVLEAELPASLISLDTTKMIEEFAPFGLANQKPLFVVRGVILKQYRLLGAKQEHLKLTVAVADREFSVLAWRRADLLQSLAIGDVFDLACSLESSVYRDKEQLQLVYKDIQKNPA